MSYIDCLFNPEGLYIWEDEEKICICQPGVDFKIVPFQAWYKVFRHLDKSGFNKSLYLGDVVEYDGFRIQEIELEKKRKKIFISYNNKWEIKICRVTLDSIKTEVIKRDIVPESLINIDYSYKLKNWFNRTWRKYV